MGQYKESDARLRQTHSTFLILSMVSCQFQKEGSKGIRGQMLERDGDEACRVKYSRVVALVRNAYKAGATKDGH